MITETQTPNLYIKDQSLSAEVMTPSKLLRAKLMLANGLSYADIASALGVSATTIQDELAN